MSKSILSKKSEKKGGLLWLKKNGLTILLFLGLVILFVSPNAKSWVIRQLMVTGIFNAKIDNEKSINVNKSVVNFNFKDGSGTIRNTESLKGKVVFINFWASWCPPCKAEMPSILALYEYFKSDSTIYFLLINEDKSFSTAQSYLNSKKFDLPLYQTIGSVANSIFSGTLPTTLILDKKGSIRYYHEGSADYSSESFYQQLESLIKE